MFRFILGAAVGLASTQQGRQIIKKTGNFLKEKVQELKNFVDSEISDKTKTE